MLIVTEKREKARVFVVVVFKSQSVCYIDTSIQVDSLQVCDIRQEVQTSSNKENLGSFVI